MTKPTVLISGAGIAGPSLAFWLIRAGYHVVVELADGIRPGGQTVDLRGAGRAIVERMGLLDQMRARSLAQRGAAWVKADGLRRAEMPVEAFRGNGLVSQLEILRGDLADVLHQATGKDAEYRFSTRITELAESDDAVVATLSDDTTVRADLVVGAGGLNASMRPSHDPALAKAGLAFRSEPLRYDGGDLDEQRELLACRFSGAGWQSVALVAAARQADDFYFDAFAQVHMDTWSSRRVTLVGDAGYCASPLSGMGTSLALVGAYVLAGELGAADDAGRAAARGGAGQSDRGPAGSRGIDGERLAAALDRYQRVMRPYVDRCQKLPNSVERFLPKSAADIRITGMVTKYMQLWPFRSFAERTWFHHRRRR